MAVSTIPQTGGAAPRQPGTTAEVLRILSGMYFLVMAFGVNARVTLRNPGVYDAMADLAVLPPYRWLLRSVIRPLATPFTLVLIVFEAVTGLLILGRGKAARLGLASAVAFQLAVIPGVALYGLVNLPVAAVQIWLLGCRFDQTAAGRVRSWLVRSRLRQEEDRRPTTCAADRS